MVFSLDRLRVERRKISDGGPVVINLPFPPSVNALFGQAPGHKRYPSAQYKTWQTAAEWTLLTARPPRVPGPVFLLFEFVAPDKRQRDVSNYIKAPEDLLVRHNVIDGDHNEVVRRIEAKWSEGEEGVRITITSERQEAMRKAA